MHSRIGPLRSTWSRTHVFPLAFAGSDRFTLGPSSSVVTTHRYCREGRMRARAALDALNENKIGVDSAYRRAYAPKRNPNTNKDERAAQGFNHQSKAHAWIQRSSEMSTKGVSISQSTTRSKMGCRRCLNAWSLRHAAEQPLPRPEKKDRSCPRIRVFHGPDANA
jgi:hypothetical protein